MARKYTRRAKSCCPEPIIYEQKVVSEPTIDESELSESRQDVQMAGDFESGPKLDVPELKPESRIEVLEKEVAYWKERALPSWEGRRLSILFPSRKETNPVTAACLVAIALDFGKDKVRFDFEHGDSMIYNARNKLADRFINDSESEWALFIDDDMILPIGRPKFIRDHSNVSEDYPDEQLAKHTVQQLLSHNKTLIGATYFGRRFNAPPMFSSGLSDPAANKKARSFVNEVIPTDWVATGCLLIHRSVFLDIQTKFPELAPSGNVKVWDYFLPEKGAGEDVAFCRRAHAAGHQPFVDLGLHALHIGYNVFGAHNTRDALSTRSNWI